MDMSMMMSTSMMEGMDMVAAQNLVEASSACEQACTMCADGSLGMAGMEKCAAMCMNCADNGIAYTEATLSQSYGIVIRYLNRVGLAAGADPFDCPAAQRFGR